MAEETTATLKAQAQEAVYAAIINQAKSIKQSSGQESAASALKNLAEAYAWVSHPTQPH